MTIRILVLISVLLTGCATAPEPVQNIGFSVDPRCTQAANYAATIVLLREVGMSLQQIEDTAKVTNRGNQPMMVMLREEAYKGKLANPDEARIYWLAACEQQGFDKFNELVM